MQIIVVVEPQLLSNPIRKLLTPMFFSRYATASGGEITHVGRNKKYLYNLTIDLMNEYNRYSTDG